MEASCVYAVEEDELVPVESGWGLPARHALLEPTRVLVFDFGSEVYVYNGKSAAFETRKIGARLAQVSAYLFNNNNNNLLPPISRWVQRHSLGLSVGPPFLCRYSWGW